MSLLTSYSKYNRAVSSDTVATYAQSRISGSWTQTAGTASTTFTEAWESRRFRSKSYSYVGMDKTTAEACVVAAVAYYTRSVITSKWNTATGTFTEESGGTRCMADVSIQHRAGNMWDVAISVHEEDARLDLFQGSPSSRFPAENNRKYDTGDQAFEN